MWTRKRTWTGDWALSPLVLGGGGKKREREPVLLAHSRTWGTTARFLHRRRRRGPRSECCAERDPYHVPGSLSLSLRAARTLFRLVVQTSSPSFLMESMLRDLVLRTFCFTFRLYTQKETGGEREREIRGRLGWRT